MGQLREDFSVPRPVAGDLGDPVGAMLLGHPRAALAVMSMPETAMHEDRDPAADIGDVRRARDVAPIEPVARGDGVEAFAQEEFGLRVLAAHRAHDVGAGGDPARPSSF